MPRAAWLVLMAVAVLPLQLAGQDIGSVLQADHAAAAACGERGVVGMMTDFLDPEGVLLWPGAQLAIGRRNALLLFPERSSIPPIFWQSLGVFLAQDSSLGVTWGVAVEVSCSTGVSPVFRRYVAAWRPRAERWSLAAFVVTGPRPSGEIAALPDVQRQGDVDSGRTFTPFVEADRAFARLAADSGASVAFGRWADDDATMFRGDGLLVQGAPGVAALVDGPAAWQWSPLAAGSSGTGDLGWTAGEATIRTSPDKVYYSKYLTVWRKSPQGDVRFLVDAGNIRPAPLPGKR